MSDPLSLSEQQHRRDVFRGIVLPMLVGVGVLVVVMAPVILLPNANQVGIVADVLMIVFVFFPVFVCLFPMYLLLLVLAFGIGHANYSTGRFLRRVNRLTSTANKRVATVSAQVDQVVLQARSSIAWVEDRLSRTFQSNSDLTQDDQDKNGD